MSAAWVAPVTRADGSAAVLKLGMPHMEGEHETDGLRFWDGDPTVRLLEFDAERERDAARALRAGHGARASCPSPSRTS